MNTANDLFSATAAAGNTAPLVATNAAGISINSRDIAELVERRHDNVKRTIESLINQDVIEYPQIEEIPTATKPVSVYVFSGERGKRDSAKVLQIHPIDLKNWLLMNRWIYGRPGHSGWLGYQDKIQAGLLCHKVHTKVEADGNERTFEQVRITSKGLTRIGESLSRLAA